MNAEKSWIGGLLSLLYVSRFYTIEPLVTHNAWMSSNNLFMIAQTKTLPLMAVKFWHGQLYNLYCDSKMF